MNKRCLIVLFSVFCFFCTNLFSQEIQGVYTNKEDGAISSIEIVDDTLCRIDTFGFETSYSYTKKNNYIIIDSQNMFRIKNSNTLIGEGALCSGTYVRDEDDNENTSDDDTDEKTQSIQGKWNGLLDDEKAILEFTKDKYKIKFLNEDNSDNDENGSYDINDNCIEFENGNECYFYIKDNVFLFLDSGYELDTEDVSVDSIDGIFMKQ